MQASPPDVRCPICHVVMVMVERKDTSTTYHCPKCEAVMTLVDPRDKRPE